MKRISTKRIYAYLLSLSFIATALVYCFGLPGEFIYDDHEQIVMKSEMHDPTNLAAVVFNGLRQMRVLQNISFAINWVISPGEAWSYKLFNLLLHLVNGWLLYLWLKLLFPRRVEVATLTAALFLAHPLQVQSVAYVMGRISLLQAFFYLLSLWIFAKHGLRQFKCLLFILVLSLVAKETCIFIAPLLLVYELGVNQKKLKALDWSRWRWILASPLLFIPILFVLRDEISYSSSGFDLYPQISYVIAQFYYLGFYPLLFLNPSAQSIIHSFPEMTASQYGIALFGLFIAIASPVVFFKNFYRAPRLSFLLLLLFINYLPTNNFFQMINPFAEYRLYLSNVSLCVGVAFLVFYVVELKQFKLQRAKLSLVLPAIVICVALLATLQQVRVWQTTISVYLQGLNLYPREQALHSNLAAAYLEKGRPSEALASLGKARESHGSLASHIAYQYYLVAIFYFKSGQADQALEIIQSMENDSKRPESFPPQLQELKQSILDQKGAKN